MFNKLIVCVGPVATNRNHTSSSSVPPQAEALWLEAVAFCTVPDETLVQVVVEFTVSDMAPLQLSFAGCASKWFDRRPNTKNVQKNIFLIGTLKGNMYCARGNPNVDYSFE